MNHPLLMLLKDPACPSLNRDAAIFIHPHIPTNKLYSAMSSYIPATVQPTEVLLLIDDTVFGGAKEGLVLTAQAIYLKEAFESPRQFALSDIQSIIGSKEVMSANLYINGQKVMNFTQPSKNSIVEFARVVTDFIADSHPQTGDPFEQCYPAIDILAHHALLQNDQWTPANVRFIKELLAPVAKTDAHLVLLKERIKLKHRPTLDQSIQSFLAYINTDLNARTFILHQVSEILYLNHYAAHTIWQLVQALGLKLGLNESTIDGVLEKTTAFTNGTESDHAASDDSEHESHHDDEVVWACGILNISTHHLTLEALQQAYRRKIKEFHPDQYQSLPESIQQMLHEKTQDLNRAKDILFARY